MPANDLGRESTPQWPEIGVSSEVRNLIDKFYALVDTESEEAFLEGIDQFAPDGFTEINERIVRGHANLLRERRASWNKVAARKHNTYRIYITDAACLDLLVIGRNDVECRNGERFSQEYAQNFVLGHSDTGRLCIRKFQAWVDFSSLREALSRPSKGTAVSTATATENSATTIPSCANSAVKSPEAEFCDAVQIP